MCGVGVDEVVPVFAGTPATELVSGVTRIRGGNGELLQGGETHASNSSESLPSAGPPTTVKNK